VSRAVDPGPTEAAKRSAPETRRELERPEPNWKPGWQQEVLARRMGRLTDSPGGGGAVGMPAVARERLEQALCRVLERRYPERRFTMKGEVDAGRQGSASLGDANGLKRGA
jgi:hypothetical protein